MEAIKPGDVVQLKSGGPEMTVEWVNSSDGETLCKWFAGVEPKEGLFHVPMLLKVKGKDS